MIAYTFLFFTYSRGVYFIVFALLAMELVNWFRFNFKLKSKKKMLRHIGVVIIVFVILFSCISKCIPKVFVTEAYAAFIQRIEGYKICYKNERFEIYQEAFQMIKNTNFLGLGLGGFAWGESDMGRKRQYSNAHNIYLTILAEGGVLFFVAFMVLFCYFCYLANIYDKKALLSLLIFAFYG